VSSAETRPLVFKVFYGIFFLAALMSSGSGVDLLGFVFVATGLLMVAAPPRVAVPRLWLVLAFALLVAGFASFLPAAWFPVPAWRNTLEGLGVRTGSQVVVQARQAVEQYGILIVMAFTGWWLAGHRASSGSLRNLALLFTAGVAVYAVLAYLLRTYLPAGEEMKSHFGFFPNRNHSGTYLAMGVTCGVGVILQSIRKKQFVRLGIGFAATALCVFAVAGWSISRGGIILSAVGIVVPVLAMGRRYFGGNELKALALLVLLAVGGFLLSQTRVMNRLSETADRVSKATAAETDDLNSPDAVERLHDIDLRLPIARDTLKMIQDAPLTGVGAGQFRYVFPQYIHFSTGVSAEAYHPESDWLWIAAELGLPAVLLLLALVVSAYIYGWRNVMAGNDRALRMACLMASALVPLHGFFDVPGRQPALLWASVFLFAIALNPVALREKAPKWTPPLFRGAGLLVVLSGLWLLGVGWSQVGSPAVVRSQDDHVKGFQAYRALRDPKREMPLWQIQHERKQLHQSMRQAIQTTPLNRYLYFLEGASLVAMQSERDRADQAFAIERALAPTRVQVPLFQSFEWMGYDPTRVAPLWKDALSRSKAVDPINQKSAFSTVRVEARIRRVAKKNPILKLAAAEAGVK
jgi:O-antigen ligase